MESTETNQPVASKSIAADEEVWAKQENKLLKTSIEKLPKKLKDTLLLTEISELSYAEAAVALDIPEGTVASRRNRALQALKRSDWVVGDYS